ncbi:MAG: DUF4377 domain-containing protein [Actinomycetia bacterium]|nr:DUF4377 domain-containing protein [Actinomycetes bacterium]
MNTTKVAAAMLVLMVTVGGCALGSSSSRQARLWIAPELADCVGVGPQKCMLVKESVDAEWEFFYDGIKGFTYTEGVSYILDVEIFEVTDPPADASSLEYRLVRIVESTPGAG